MTYPWWLFWPPYLAELLSTAVGIVLVLDLAAPFGTHKGGAA